MILNVRDRTGYIYDFLNGRISLADAIFSNSGILVSDLIIEIVNKSNLSVLN